MAFVLAAKPAAPKQIDPSSLGLGYRSFTCRQHLPANSYTVLPNSFAYMLILGVMVVMLQVVMINIVLYRLLFLARAIRTSQYVSNFPITYWMSWLYFKAIPPLMASKPELADRIPLCINGGKRQMASSEK